MKVLPVLTALTVSVCACQNNANDPHRTNDTLINRDSTTEVPSVSMVNDTLIRMRFSASDTGILVTAQPTLTGDKRIVCEVNVQKADSMYAEVKPVDAGGNVRFSQIIMPDGKADGPFGQTLQYLTPVPGVYKIIINENQMAGDKWRGKFVLKVWVR